MAHLPPVSVLFAAFLRYNPIQSLLGPSGVLGRVSRTDRSALLGRGFFPHLISTPFADGLHTAFTFSLVLCLIAAVASWLRGGKYHYAAEVPAAPPPPAPAVSDEVGAGARLEELIAELAHWRRQALESPGPLVVAISASYGAQGGVIGPLLAERLGLPFIDRAIPAAVAQELAVPLEEALAYDDRASHGVIRVLAMMSQAATPYGVQRLDPGDAIGTAELMKVTTELVLWRLAATTGGVVLGRASTLVLAEYPNAFRIRLDGPVDARIHLAMAHTDVDESTARRAERDSDRARDAYVRHLYGADMHDPSHFHLYADITVIEPEACVDLLEGWVRHRLPAEVMGYRM